MTLPTNGISISGFSRHKERDRDSTHTLSHTLRAKAHTVWVNARDSYAVRICESLPRLRCYLATEFANSKAWRCSRTLTIFRTSFGHPPLSPPSFPPIFNEKKENGRPAVRVGRNDYTLANAQFARKQGGSFARQTGREIYRHDQRKASSTS